ncbi:MAG: hypothetical protein PVI41_01195 [Roseobacter sp.]|jgi:hypothetical protein
MPRISTFLCAVTMSAISTFASPAGAGNPGISDQSYSGGKYSGGRSITTNALANCPREFRGIYRGSLYCRTPAYQVIAPRHRLCPEGFKGMYRGDLYCTGRI